MNRAEQANLIALSIAFVVGIGLFFLLFAGCTVKPSYVEPPGPQCLIFENGQIDCRPAKYRGDQ